MMQISDVMEDHTKKMLMMFMAVFYTGVVTGVFGGLLALFITGGVYVIGAVVYVMIQKDMFRPDEEAGEGNPKGGEKTCG